MNDPRLEAAMTGLLDGWKSQEQRAGNVIARLDEADREQGIHRVRVDDEAAGGLAQVIHDNLCGCSEEYVECDGYFSVPETMLNAARAVLAALTGAES